MATGFLISDGAVVKGATLGIKGVSRSSSTVNVIHKTEENVTIYRGVGLDEHYDILKTKQFRIDGRANYETGKFYFEDRKQAEKFADKYRDVVAIHQANIQKMLVLYLIVVYL